MQAFTTTSRARIRLGGGHIAAAEHFKTAITLSMGNKKNLEEFLMENVVLLRWIDRIASRYWSFGSEILLSKDDIAAIAQDTFCCDAP